MPPKMWLGYEQLKNEANYVTEKRKRIFCIYVNCVAVFVSVFSVHQPHFIKGKAPFTSIILT